MSIRSSLEDVIYNPASLSTWKERLLILYPTVPKVFIHFYYLYAYVCYDSLLLIFIHKYFRAVLWLSEIQWHFWDEEIQSQLLN